MATSSRARVLFVDDSQNLLGAVRRTLRGKADLIVAESAQAALQILEADPSFSVVVSDQKMPGMKGVEFLATVAQRWPLVTRVMQTGNNDQDTAISAIHDGRVFRFLRKPYEPEDLLEVIFDAQAEHDIRAVEHTLLETNLAASIKLVTEMLAMTRPDLFARSTKVHELTKSLAAQLHMSQPWELSLAALLYPLGLVTLPNELLEKRKKGDRLSEAEAFALSRSGMIAGDLVQKIPKLERVAIYLRYCRKYFDGSGLPDDLDPPDTPPHAVCLLPLLIDIVELADSRDIRLKDAALALHDNAGKYHPGMLHAATEWLKKRAIYEETHDRTVRELHAENVMVGDILVNDLHGVDRELLLTGGSELTELMVRRIHLLSESGVIPPVLAVARAA
jgi:response regulator RpfG family c-di-GMP phosphodiesterase